MKERVALIEALIWRSHIHMQTHIYLLAWYFPILNLILSLSCMILLSFLQPLLSFLFYYNTKYLLLFLYFILYIYLIHTCLFSGTLDFLLYILSCSACLLPVLLFTFHFSLLFIFWFRIYICQNMVNYFYTYTKKNYNTQKLRNFYFI